MSPGALDGVRVLELGLHVVGPLAARQLACLGAEVIRVETSKPPLCAGRLFPSLEIPGAMYDSVGSGKKSLSLDISTSKGQKLFLRLIEKSDIYVSNLRAEALRKWGVDYPAVKARKPDVIMIFQPAMGTVGPYSTYKGYGTTMQAICGQMDFSGFPGEPPAFSNTTFADWLAPQYACLCAIRALEYRRKTGKGMFIEVPLYESGVTLLGPSILEYTVNNRIVSRTGNRHPFAAPHGIYRCKGDDRWCAITVFTLEEWASFCNVIGNPPWTRERKFAAVTERLKHQDELDRLVAEWTSHHAAEEVMHLMQKAGVPAGVVYRGEDLAESKHLWERGFYRETPRYPPPATKGTPAAGTTLAMELPIILSETPRQFTPGRRIGEDNYYVCGTLLGMTGQEIEELEKESVLI